MNTIQLTISKPFPFYYMCDDGNNEEVVGHGDSIQKAIESWLDLMELRANVEREDIKYKWS
jgi:hypothetical protein